MVCTAVWPFLPHVYMIFVLFVFMYEKSPSAVEQVLTQFIIHQEIFMVYMTWDFVVELGSVDVPV